MNPYGRSKKTIHSFQISVQRFAFGVQLIFYLTKNTLKYFDVSIYLCPVILKEADMDSKKFEKVSRALSDPHRLRILEKFRKKCDDTLYCSEIHDFLDLAQPSVSHHLKQLVEAELLIPEKEGRNLKYNLNQEVLNDYIAFLTAFKA